MPTPYDIIVIGGGHAGCEAALAASRMGMRTCLVTMNLPTIGQMSCNPAVGGLAKGQLVKEIDALGGEMGRVTDLAMVHFRMLNRSKGPAVWSPRAQCDRNLYAHTMRIALESQKNLDLKQNMATEIVTCGGKVSEVVCVTGQRFECRAAIVCPGTFLNARIFTGEFSQPAGRIGEAPALGLSESLLRHDFSLARLKTGTPPRLDGRTIDYSRCEMQPGDARIVSFSKRTHNIIERQLDCHLTYSNPRTHDVLRSGLSRSPLYGGVIKGVGPRYCPSIEDKIVRFADKDRHQLFLEPEGWHTFEIYINGFASSLPEEIQFEALRTIQGLEHVEMMRPGYAVEYDFFPSHQIHSSLETKPVERLFFAGQINGTTGYEEAAAQGIIAGINAVKKIKGEQPLILRRDQAYIGVLIDDLITKTPVEPYRMFTSRAEYRLLLRQDNADIRLTDIGRSLGLVSDAQHELHIAKKQLLKDVKEFLANTSLESIPYEGILSDRSLMGVRFAALLKRPEIKLADLVATQPELAPIHRITEDEDLAASVEMDVKYEGYIIREHERAERMRTLDDYRLPEVIDYKSIAAISFEGREKLNRFRPQTLGQAGRIDGVSPADCSALLIYLKKLKKE
ncbi:tRNA uridine-5-carboxymethylaminomethyl(34) synthesis enzyme MnmG [candidate division KSB1 bacterium]|nr:MAG: tRNA uridine-5-carboxymethylaminomethyl(34) synthesis enzyme MnmG [candidate division KSB1 bacterium]